MSHVVQIQTEVRDVVAARTGCRRLGLPEPVNEEVRLFSETVTGLAVRLRDWRYPAVFDTKTGQGRFDNYGGKWGPQARLDQFLQATFVHVNRLKRNALR